MGSEGLSQMIANEVSSSGFMPDFAYQMSVTIWFEPPTYRLRADCYYCPKYALKHIFQAELRAHVIVFKEILSYLKVFGLSKRYN